MRYLLLATLLLCQTAWACESYEECMKPNPLHCPPTLSCSQDGPNYYGAIAYKLDEISKKLDKKEEEYLPMGPMLLKKEKMK